MFGSPMTEQSFAVKLLPTLFFYYLEMKRVCDLSVRTDVSHFDKVHEGYRYGNLNHQGIDLVPIAISEGSWEQ